MVSRGWIGILVAGVVAVTAGVSVARDGAGTEFTPSQKGHWAWKKPARPAVPKVHNSAWVRNPIDAFVLEKLESEGLKPAPTTSREQLIRRLAYDLTGLPPTPVEVDAFLADSSPNAWEKVIDRYLASPAYGERWARHWLDLARYADTNGYEHDEVRPDAWRYRDYVVRSLNADKPYNRFVLEQLAGDEIAPEDGDALVATGFNLLGPDMTDAADQGARRQNTLNDMTDTAGLAFLGLTVGCARCHDHKYEPITQADYFRLQAFFTPAQFRKDLPVGTAEERAVAARELAAHDEKIRAKQKEIEAVAGEVRTALRAEKIAKLPEEVQTAFALPEKERTVDQQNLVNRHQAAVEPPARDVSEKLSPNARARFEALAKDLRLLEMRRPAATPTAIGLSETGLEPPKTFILERGEFGHRGTEVSPGFPIILTRSTPAIAPAPRSTGRRTALARWIASADNPLTARVMINRVWQGHFGRGIIPTSSDLGLRGESPTHPELLDWLAAEFSKTWSVKRLHRLIVTSNTYKQSSQGTAETLGKDPDNLLFSRMNRRRLEAEAIRDAGLAISGRLNPKMGGPGVFPPIPEGARSAAAAWPVSGDPADHTRRSLYIFVRRNLHFPQFEAFDSPDTNLSCARRETSITAPQALALMNGSETLENARYLAGRVLKEAPDAAARITQAYRLALGRKPTEAELKLGQEFVQNQSALLKSRPAKELMLPKPANEAVEPAQAAAFTDYCLALLNLNEFVYLD